MKNKNVIIWIFLAIAIPSVCQNSIKRYDNILGEKTIIRTNEKNYTYVTCSHTSDDRSCFIVKNLKRAEITKAFYTSQHVNPLPPFISNIGYWVSDIVVTPTQCWFCGTKWEETGNYIYTGSSPYLCPETIFCSYVGWFDLFDVVDYGAGDFNVVEFNNIVDLYLKKLVVCGSSVTAISDDKILEMYNIQNNSCSYRLGSPNWCNETFVDIVLSGDSVITVSRFNNPSAYFYYHDFFALRYGPTANNNFISNNNAYMFDTYNMVGGDTWARFFQLESIKMTTMCNKRDAVVSYLARDVNSNNPIPGHLVMIHIPNENAHPSEIITSDDTSRYRTLKDASSSSCNYGNNMCMSFLLDDSTDRQILRYPIPGRGYGNFPDTIKRVGSPRLDAIAVGHYYDENAPDYYWLMAAGVFLSDNKVAEVQDRGIRAIPERQHKTCLNNINGSFHSQSCMSNSWYDTNKPLSISSSGARPIMQHPFSSFAVQTTTMCNTGSSQMLEISGETE